MMILALLAGSAPFVRAHSAEQTFQFDCDVPPAKFSEWNATLSPGLTRISGRVELIESRSHERWNPTASVLLVRGDEYVGLQLHVVRAAPEVVQVSVYRPKEKGGRTLLMTVPWRAHPVAFTLTHEASGEFLLNVEGKEAALGVTDFRPDKLSLGCSTGEFKFIDIAVTSVGNK
jgi:hypothetical protein